MATIIKEINKALNIQVHGVRIKDIPLHDLINLKNDKTNTIKELDVNKDKLKIERIQKQINALELVIKNA